MDENLALFAEFDGQIDPENGILRGVSLIKLGEARGHGQKIDSTTLDQVITTCGAFKNGVKVKLNHEGGAGDIVGVIKNVRLSDDASKAIGDLHLLKNHPSRDYILELAATAPDTFGLSINFMNKPFFDGKDLFARCERIRSADIVADPAANDTGLFSLPAHTIKVDNQKISMNEIKKLQEAIEAMKTEFSAKQEELTTRITSLEEENTSLKTALKEGKKDDKSKEEDENQDDKDEEDDDEVNEGEMSEAQKKHFSELTTKIEALSELVKTGAGQVSKNPSMTGSDSSAAAEGEKTPATFEEIVESLVKEGKFKSKSEATSFAVKNHTDEHKAYLVRIGAIKA